MGRMFQKHTFKIHLVIIVAYHLIEPTSFSPKGRGETKQLPRIELIRTFKG